MHIDGGHPPQFFSALVCLNSPQITLLTFKLFMADLAKVQDAQLNHALDSLKGYPELGPNVKDIQYGLLNGTALTTSITEEWPRYFTTKPFTHCDPMSCNMKEGLWT